MNFPFDSITYSTFISSFPSFCETLTYLLLQGQKAVLPADCCHARASYRALNVSIWYLCNELGISLLPLFSALLLCSGDITNNMTFKTKSASETFCLKVDSIHTKIVFCRIFAWLVCHLVLSYTISRVKLFTDFTRLGKTYKKIQHTEFPHIVSALD